MKFFRDNKEKKQIIQHQCLFWHLILIHSESFYTKVAVSSCFKFLGHFVCKVSEFWLLFYWSKWIFLWKTNVRGRENFGWIYLMHLHIKHNQNLICRFFYILSEGFWDINMCIKTTLWHQEQNISRYINNHSKV